MQKNICLFLISVLLFIGAFSQPSTQSSTLDSLLRLIKTTPDDTNKVNLCRQAGVSIIYENPVQSIPYFRQGINLAKTLQFIRGLARCYSSSYLAYSFNAKYDTALLYIDSAIALSTQISNSNELALYYLNRADVYTNLQKLSAALKNCDTAIQYAEQAGNKERLGRIYSIMSDIYAAQENYTAAFTNLDKSELLFKEVQHAQMLGMTNFGRALLYQSLSEYDKAIPFFKSAIHIADSVHDISNLPAYTCGLAQTYAMLKRYAEAEAVIKTSLQYALQLQHRKQEAVAYDFFYNIYTEQKEYTKAIAYGLKAYNIMKEEKDLLREQGMASNLAEGYYLAGNMVEAYKYLKISRDLNDSLVKEQYNEEAARLQTTFEVVQKDKEIQLLNKDKELHQQRMQKQRLLTLGAVAIAGLALLGIWLLMNRNKLKQRMKELELRNRIAADLHDEVGSSLSSIHMLSQMATQRHSSDDKHNDILSRMSLNAKETMEKMSDIVWMIKPGDTEEGNLLERMQRFAQEITGSKNIVLNMELDAVEKTKLTMEQRKNIYLIFKEAVNNAAKYSGTAKMDVTAELIHKTLKIIIKDYGKGFDISTVKKGNGLYNIENRVKELNGKLTVNTTLHSGTIIELVIPV